MGDTKILEREVVHAGQTFIRAGENKTDSFIVQEGEVISFISESGARIEVDRYTAGMIIAESNLLLNEPSPLNYEAAVTTTMVRITRQDFEKKMKKVDFSLYNIVVHLVKKLKDQEARWKEQTVKGKHNDFKALQIVDHLLRDMDNTRKKRYQDVLLPHFNVMVKSLEELKNEERTTRQKQALEERVAALKGEEAVAQ